MDLDEIDVEILKELSSLQPNETVTTIKIAKKLFKEEVKDDYALRRKASFIRSRMNKLHSFKFLNKESCEAGKFMYSVNRKNCIYHPEGRLSFHNGNGSQLEVDKGEFLFLKGEEGGYHFFKM